MYNQLAAAPGRSLNYPRLKSITHLRTFSDNGVYVARVRCHEHMSDAWTTSKAIVKDGWMLMIYFNLEEHTYAQMREFLKESLLKNNKHTLTSSLFLMKVPEGLTQNKLKVEKSAGGEVDVITLETDDDVIDAVHTHFPLLSEVDVRKAVTYWSAEQII